MINPRTNKLREPGSTLSLEHLLLSFTVSSPPPSQAADGQAQGSSGVLPSPPPPISLPPVTMHNSGNDAFMALFAMQVLLEPEGIQVPTVKKGMNRMTMQVPMQMQMPMQRAVPFPAGMSMSLSMPMPATDHNGGLSVPFGGHSMRPVSGFTPGQEQRQYSLPIPASSSPYDLSDEFGKLQVERKQTNSGGLERPGEKDKERERKKSRSRSPGPDLGLSAPNTPHKKRTSYFPAATNGNGNGHGYADVVVGSGTWPRSPGHRR
jgi:hypothetical protein